MITAAQMYTVDKLTKRLIKRYSLDDTQREQYKRAIQGDMSKSEASVFVGTLMRLSEQFKKGGF